MVRLLSLNEPAKAPSGGVSPRSSFVDQFPLSQIGGPQRGPFAYGHTLAETEANGFFAFSWTPNGVHPLLVWKDGYVVVNPVRMLSDGRALQDATVGGDTRFDIRIARR